MGLDPRTGELVVIVPTATAAAKGEEALRARLEAIAGVPVRLRVLDQVDVNLSAPEGGSRVEGVNPADGKRYLCTTAFTVTDGTRYGIATAAHCVDDLSLHRPAARRRRRSAMSGNGAGGIRTSRSTRRPRRWPGGSTPTPPARSSARSPASAPATKRARAISCAIAARPPGIAAR